MRLACGHLLIADTCGAGLEFVRKHVAEFITERDGFPANADDIFLTAGASPAVQMTLRVLIRDATDGIMVPIPQVVLTHCPAYALSAVPKQLPHCTCVGVAWCSTLCTLAPSPCTVGVWCDTSCRKGPSGA